MSEPLAAAIERHLVALVDGYPDRHPGRPGNTAANDYVEGVLQAHGWAVESVDFEVLDADVGPARLSVGGRAFELLAGPYTVPASVSAPLLPVDSLAALEGADISGAVVCFTATSRPTSSSPSRSTSSTLPTIGGSMSCWSPGLRPPSSARQDAAAAWAAGSIPYPLIEDGDFDLPNAYTTDEIGAQLAPLAGQVAELEIVSERQALWARQLTAARGPAGAPRALVMAHIDSKGGSPGALDNATGVAALLGVAELLAEYDGPYRVELIPMNGEDYYASSGEHLFVAANEGRWDELLGTVNMDAIGAKGASTAASLYAVSERGAELIGRVVRRHPTVSLGEEWYESDHSIVAGHGRPAIALTSTSFRELCATVTHTERDTLELADPALVAGAAEFVADLLRSLPAVGGPEA